MNSPRSGFRRAALTSWTLAGLGVAGVAGASVLAYADTYQPPVAEAPADVAEPAAPAPAVQLPTAPPVVLPPPTQEAPPPPPPPPPPVEPPAPAVTQEPAETYTPAPAYTAPRYTAAPTVQQQAPAPTKAPKQPAFPIRQSHVPIGGGSSGNNYSPHVTVSRGS